MLLVYHVTCICCLLARLKVLYSHPLPTERHSMAAETNEVMKSETLERQLCQEANIRRKTLLDNNQNEWLRLIEIHIDKWEAKKDKVTAKLERLQKRLQVLSRQEMQEYEDMREKDRQYMESVEETYKEELFGIISGKRRKEDLCERGFHHVWQAA